MPTAISAPAHATARFGRSRAPLCRIASVATLLLIACGACGGGGEQQGAISASSELAKSIASQVAKPAPPKPAAPAVEGSVVIHLDASQSMAGFVNCQQSPTAFDGVLDRLMVDLGVTSVRVFGAGQGAAAAGQESVAGKALHCPTLYSRSQNPDYQLFRQIREDSAGATHLYVTDGVQSDVVGANQSPSVEQLVRWVSAGRALEILAFRSEFAGRAWSETRKQWIGAANVTDRPFYVFAFAPTDAALDAALGQISQATLQTAATRLRFSDTGAACRTRRAPSTFMINEDPAIPWVMLAKQAVDNAQTAPIAVGEYVCTIQSRFPLAAVQARVVDPRYGRWNGTTFEFPTGLPNGTRIDVAEAKPTAEGSAAPVRALLPTTGAPNYGFFHITLAATPGALRPAVDSLSADSDARLEDYGRTYRLSWLVERLARAQVARAVPEQHFFFTASYNQ